MQDGTQQPYFFNPGMTAEQLEDWLGQQKSKRRLSTVWSRIQDPVT